MLRVENAGVAERVDQQRRVVALLKSCRIVAVGYETCLDSVGFHERQLRACGREEPLALGIGADSRRRTQRLPQILLRLCEEAVDPPDAPEQFERVRSPQVPDLRKSYAVKELGVGHGQSR